MLLIGLGLMFLLWAKEWSYQKEITESDSPIRGCTEGVKCPNEKPICVSGPKAKSGVCTVGCASRTECPENWCCATAPNGKGKPPRCMPFELCPAAQ